MNPPRNPVPNLPPLPEAVMVTMEDPLVEAQRDGWLEPYDLQPRPKRDDGSTPKRSNAVIVALHQRFNAIHGRLIAPNECTIPVPNLAEVTYGLPAQYCCDLDTPEAMAFLDRMQRDKPTGAKGEETFAVHFARRFFSNLSLPRPLLATDNDNVRRYLYYAHLLTGQYNETVKFKMLMPNAARANADQQTLLGDQEPFDVFRISVSFIPPRVSAAPWKVGMKIGHIEANDQLKYAVTCQLQFADLISESIHIAEGIVERDLIDAFKRTSLANAKLPGGLGAHYEILFAYVVLWLRSKFRYERTYEDSQKVYPFAKRQFEPLWRSLVANNDKYEVISVHMSLGWNTTSSMFVYNAGSSDTELPFEVVLDEKGTRDKTMFQPETFYVCGEDNRPLYVHRTKRKATRSFGPRATEVLVACTDQPLAGNTRHTAHDFSPAGLTLLLLNLADHARHLSFTANTMAMAPFPDSPSGFNVRVLFEAASGFTGTPLLVQYRQAVESAADVIAQTSMRTIIVTKVKDWVSSWLSPKRA